MISLPISTHFRTCLSPGQIVGRPQCKALTCMAIATNKAQLFNRLQPHGYGYPTFPSCPLVGNFFFFWPTSLSRDIAIHWQQIRQLHQTRPQALATQGSLVSHGCCASFWTIPDVHPCYRTCFYCTLISTHPIWCVLVVPVLTHHK